VFLRNQAGQIEANSGDLVNAIEASGFIELPVREIHAAGVAALPLHHTDPRSANKNRSEYIQQLAAASVAFGMTEHDEAALITQNHRESHCAHTGV
jgi:hypothetical protein